MLPNGLRSGRGDIESRADVSRKQIDERSLAGMEAECFWHLAPAHRANRKHCSSCLTGIMYGRENRLAIRALAASRACKKGQLLIRSTQECCTHKCSAGHDTTVVSACAGTMHKPAHAKAEASSITPGCTTTAGAC